MSDVTDLLAALVQSTCFGTSVRARPKDSCLSFLQSVDNAVCACVVGRIGAVFIRRALYLLLVPFATWLRVSALTQISRGVFLFKLLQG